MFNISLYTYLLRNKAMGMIKVECYLNYLNVLFEAFVTDLYVIFSKNFLLKLI